MPTVRELHNKAMILAQESLAYRYTGRLEEAKEIILDAYALERAALALVPVERTSQPTYSILCLSVASLAFQVGYNQEAKRYCSKGLSIECPEPIKSKLIKLYSQITDKE